MRKIPQTYKEFFSELPATFILMADTPAYYRNPNTNIERRLKIKAGTGFFANDLPESTEQNGIIGTDILVTRVRKDGDWKEVRAYFKFNELLPNLKAPQKGEKIERKTDSILIYGIKKPYFFIGLASIPILIGVYLITKNS